MKILILGYSGSGKTSAACPIKELDIKGLNPKSTFFITTTSRELPYRGGLADYKEGTLKELVDMKNTKKFFNRLITNKPVHIAQALHVLSTMSVFKDVVLDDSNFVMQDYYAENCLVGGFDVFKSIGDGQARINKVLQNTYKGPDKNIWVLAHPEDGIMDGMREKYIMKTAGRMVRQTMTPEAKFDMVLCGHGSWDDMENKAKKVFITNEHELISGAKSFPGMLDLEVPNDFGFIKDKIKEYYAPQS
jgi:hypothetical protein